MFDLEDVEYPDPNIATLAMNFRTVVWYLKNFPYVLEAILSSRVLDEDFDLSTLCPNPHSCDQFPCENLCCVAREIIR